MLSMISGLLGIFGAHALSNVPDTHVWASRMPLACFVAPLLDRYRIRHSFRDLISWPPPIRLSTSQTASR